MALGASWKKFLVNPEKDVNWHKWIPMTALKRDILFILQNYVTCEGKYELVFFYHLCLLMHFEKDHHISFPYYLLKNLNKMAFNIQCSHKN